MPRTRNDQYTSTAKLLHWLVAGLIVAAFLLGWSMVDLPLSLKKLHWYNYHKWIGMTALGLVGIRLMWRLLVGAPTLPASMHGWEKHAAHGAHLLMYLLMLAVPLVGWATTSAKGFPVVYLGLILLPDWIGRDAALGEQLSVAHTVLSYALVGLAALHALAALKHFFIDRDDVLQRMLPGHR